MVRAIQNLRKEKGLEVTDRISLSLYGSEVLKRAIEIFEEHLVSETLAASWSWQKEDGATAVSFGEERCYIALAKLK